MRTTKAQPFLSSNRTLKYALAKIFFRLPIVVWGHIPDLLVMLPAGAANKRPLASEGVWLFFAIRFFAEMLAGALKQTPLSLFLLMLGAFCKRLMPEVPPHYRANARQEMCSCGKGVRNVRRGFFFEIIVWPRVEQTWARFRVCMCWRNNDMPWEIDRQSVREKNTEHIWFGDT